MSIEKLIKFFVFEDCDVITKADVSDIAKLEGGGG
jgi:hypothetical protein